MKGATPGASPKNPPTMQATEASQRLVTIHASNVQNGKKNLRWPQKPHPRHNGVWVSGEDVLCWLVPRGG